MAASAIPRGTPSPASVTAATTTRTDELTRQIQTLLDRGYPALADTTDTDFRALLTPLYAALNTLPDDSDDDFDFVLVVTRDLVRPDQVVPLIDVRGKRGWTDMPAADLAAFHPITGVVLPDAPAYLLTGIDTGKATLNVAPNDALPLITASGRTPLTIDEGLAVMLQFPDVLTTHNAFQLLGSRCGDKRVPTIWRSYGKPRLGWCWGGNPHTWLGSASAAARVGPG